MDGYQEEGLTYADLNPQTIMLSDGVRSRKTATGYVVEVMGSDEHWHAITGSDWDSETKFNAGTIVLDRGGQWKARVANTNSRPVSGNTDWELVGGLPYVDVDLDPVQLTTAPFVDPESEGLGFPTGLGAPGENLIVLPVMVDSLASIGEAWAGGDSNNVLQVSFWHTSPVAAVAAGENSQFSFGDNALTDATGLNFFSPRRSWPVLGAGGFQGDAVALISASPSTVINAPLMITGNGDELAALGVGACALRIRIYYQIVSVAQLTGRFWRVTAVNQGTKTFTVSDQYDQAAGLLGTTFTILGSTGNDGTYTIVSATFDTDHTDIVVTEDIPDDTADGWVKQ